MAENSSGIGTPKFTRLDSDGKGSSTAPSHPPGRAARRSRASVEHHAKAGQVRTKSEGTGAVESESARKREDSAREHLDRAKTGGVADAAKHEKDARMQARDSGASGAHEDDSERFADVVLVLRHDRLASEVSDERREEHSVAKKSRAQIYKQIVHSGLTLRRRQSAKCDDEGRPKYMYLLVSARQSVLEKEAERMGLVKRMVDEYTDKLTGVRGHESFSILEKERFEPAFDSFFSSLERQRIIFAKLEAGLTDGGAGLDIADLISAEMFSTCFPLSHEPTLSLLEGWLVRPWQPLPLEEIREYYGERIAFYFAYMKHYVNWLGYIFPAAVIVFSLQTARGSIDNELLPIFAGLLAIWSTLVVEAWKLRAGTLAFQWHVEDYLKAEPSRPDFIKHPLSSRKRGVYTSHGFVHTEDDDTAEVPHIPRTLQLWRIGATSSVTWTLMASVAIGAVSILGLKAIIRVTYSAEWWGPYMGSVINCAFMQIMDFVWRYLGIWLNDREVWRTETEYENALLIKGVLFRFVNSYTAPIYIAFFQGARIRLFVDYPEGSPYAGQPVVDECPNDDCLGALNAYMIVVIVLMEGVRNLSTLAPLVLSWIRNWNRERRNAQHAAAGASERLPSPTSSKFKASEEARLAKELAQIEAEMHSPEYAGTTSEMVEMAVQFGYLTAFSIAFPFALVFVAFNNFFEIRTDALKLFKCRRPRYRGANGIGPLLPILEIVSILSVVVNTLLIYYFSNTFARALPSLSGQELLLFLVGIEHGIFAIKFCLVLVVPSTPKWVEAARTRLKLRREDEFRSLVRTNHMLELDTMDMDMDDDGNGKLRVEQRKRDEDFMV